MIAHVNILLYTGIFYHVYSVMHYMSVYTGIELPRLRHHDKITTVGLLSTQYVARNVGALKVAQLHILKIVSSDCLYTCVASINVRSVNSVHSVGS